LLGIPGLSMRRRREKITDPITVTHPGKVKFWNYDLNDGRRPEDFHYGDDAVVAWVCPINPMHRWKQAVSNFLKRQTDCMYCARKPVRESLRLSTKYPELAREWHPTLNDHRSPDTILARDRRSAYWDVRGE